ncbi:MAG: HlyD family secretion protein, partial [Isosphaeraceae bacterium]
MRRTRLAWIGTGLALALILMSANPRSSRGLSWFGPNRRPSYATTPVRRADLRGTVVAGGRVDSTDKTIIECELEAAIGASWGSAAILSLLPEGTRVKKGDLLCSLDSARQEEKLRLAEILVGQARADLTEAELNLEIARLAVTEYREGLMRMTLKTLNGQIALTRSELERTQDRLNWSRRMLEKGYLSRAQVATEEQIVAR